MIRRHVRREKRRVRRALDTRIDIAATDEVGSMIHSSNHLLLEYPGPTGGMVATGDISLETRARDCIHPLFSGNDDGTMYEASVDSCVYFTDPETCT